MPEIVARLEAEYFGSDKVKERAEQVKQGINEVVDVYFRQFMREEMEALNSKIDSPEEYGGFSKRINDCTEAYRKKRNFKYAK